MGSYRIDCAEDWLAAVDGIVLIGGGDMRPPAERHAAAGFVEQQPAHAVPLPVAVDEQLGHVAPGLMQQHEGQRLALALDQQQLEGRAELALHPPVPVGDRRQCGGIGMGRGPGAAPDAGQHGALAAREFAASKVKRVGLRHVGASCCAWWRRWSAMKLWMK